METPIERDWKAEYEKLQGQYQDDMNKLYGAITQAQGQHQPQAPPPPDWDVQDPNRLKEQVTGAFRQTLNETMAPVVTTLAGNQFEANVGIMRADARFPHFQRFEAEIRQLAGQVQPGLLANMHTLAQLYQLVASKHHNELVEEEVKSRIQAQAEQQQPEDDGVDVEEEGEEPAKPEPPPPPHPQPQPQPQRATVPVQQSRSLRTPARIRLTREEAWMAEKLGMTPKEYADAKNIGDIAI